MAELKSFIQLCIEGNANPEDINSEIERWHDLAVPCFYCGGEAMQTPYGALAVHIGCSVCTKPNSVVEYRLEDAVVAWNKEQKRLANMRRKSG